MSLLCQLAAIWNTSITILPSGTKSVYIPPSMLQKWGVNLCCMYNYLYDIHTYIHDLTLRKRKKKNWNYSSVNRYSEKSFKGCPASSYTIEIHTRNLCVRPYTHTHTCDPRFSTCISIHLMELIHSFSALCTLLYLLLNIWWVTGTNTSKNSLIAHCLCAVTLLHLVANIIIVISAQAVYDNACVRLKYANFVLLIC